MTDYSLGKFPCGVRSCTARIHPGRVAQLLERSLGPFVNRDGRRLWFDFFRIEKLVALYVQGVPEPALLFKIRTGFRFIDINLPLSADAAVQLQIKCRQHLD